MKSTLLFLTALGLALVGTGCGHLDVRPAGDPQRTVSGVVTMSAQQVLFPPGTEVVVRVIDTTAPERPINGLNGTDQVVPDRNTLAKYERVVGEQIVRSPGVAPVPFTLSFEADDTTLRRGLTLEARISLEGKLQYRAMSAPVVTLSNYQQKHEIAVEAVR